MYCIASSWGPLSSAFYQILSDSTIGRSSTGSIIHPRVIDRILDHLRGELADSFSVLVYHNGGLDPKGSCEAFGQLYRLTQIFCFIPV
ncbi:hypothetical protein PGTUg99_019834 [Puccinia graminis f. sp. tritici]|uniref:Uncharacterized protein n=1 Tax=Puccinia graminis f. sp. tritici TaxID=56615 RepID=A0A5B0R4X9_PUCGR|nr:hypothetical protein PGTUg99_019834 [Puccinia graminis f. sp. tritici]